MNPLDDALLTNSVSPAEELQALQHSVTGTVLKSSMWPKLGPMQHSWGLKVHAAANVEKTALWAAETLATLEADGSAQRYRSFNARVQKLYELAETHRRRLTSEHFLMDLVVMELVSHPFVSHLSGTELALHSSAAIAASDKAVYEGKALSSIVVDLESLVKLAEAKDGVDLAALTSVKALLIELEFRVSVLE